MRHHPRTRGALSAIADAAGFAAAGSVDGIAPNIMGELPFSNHSGHKGTGMDTEAQFSIGQLLLCFEALHLVHKRLDFQRRHDGGGVEMDGFDAAGGFEFGCDRIGQDGQRRERDS